MVSVILMQLRFLEAIDLMVAQLLSTLWQAEQLPSARPSKSPFEPAAEAAAGLRDQPEPHSSSRSTFDGVAPVIAAAESTSSPLDKTAAGSASFPAEMAAAASAGPAGDRAPAASWPHQSVEHSVAIASQLLDPPSHQSSASGAPQAVGTADRAPSYSNRGLPSGHAPQCYPQAGTAKNGLDISNLQPGPSWQHAEADFGPAERIHNLHDPTTSEQQCRPQYDSTSAQSEQPAEFREPTSVHIRQHAGSNAEQASGAQMEQPQPRFAICITGDHSTPVAYGDHSHDPVPFAIARVRDVVDGLGGRAWVRSVPMGPIAPPEGARTSDLTATWNWQDQQAVSPRWDDVARFDEISAAAGALGRFPGQQVMPLVKAFISMP